MLDHLELNEIFNLILVYIPKKLLKIDFILNDISYENVHGQCFDSKSLQKQ